MDIEEMNKPLDKLTEVINILEEIDVSELQLNDQLEIVNLKERCLLLFYRLHKKEEGNYDN